MQTTCTVLGCSLAVFLTGCGGSEAVAVDAGQDVVTDTPMYAVLGECPLGPPWFVCNGAPADPLCVDTTSDPMNCGECQHVCAHGTVCMVSEDGGGGVCGAP